MRDGNSEPLLGPVQNPFRQHPAQRALEQELGAKPAQLHAQRQVRRVLDEVVVEQRHAPFERGHHRGAVQLDQDVVLQVETHVHQKHLVQWVCVGRRPEVHLAAAVGKQLLPHVLGQQRRPLLVNERAHPPLVALRGRIPGAADKPLGAEVEAQVASRHRQAAHERFDQVLAQHAWRLQVERREAVCLQSRIAGEQLVAPIAAERDLDMPPGESRQQVGRDDRGVAKRLVEQARQAGDQTEQHVRLQGELAVLRSEVARHLPRVTGLVERSLGEAD